MIHHVLANRSSIWDWLSTSGIQPLPGPYPVVEHLCDELFVQDNLARLATATES
jgi:hypothetical protein